MLTILDRHLIFNYVKAYIVCLVSLLGLFIVVDLFMNLDAFAEAERGFWPVLQNIAIYYGLKVTQIFDRLSEPIVLLAAMFTVAWMQRNNEILPLLSAGVSVRRAVRPVLFGACLMLALSIVNQEMVLPNIDWYRAENRQDPKGNRETFIQGGYESNGIFLTGAGGVKKDLMVRDMAVVFPAKVAWDGLVTIQAKEARYVPPGEGPRSGGWILTGAVPAELAQPSRLDVLEFITPGTYFLKTSEIDFDTMIRPKYWYFYVNTLDLLREITRTHSTQTAGVAVIFHQRLARPILGLLLVFMGLSIILRDQNRNIFISAGLCLILCAFYFVLLFGCKHLGDRGYLAPAMAAFIPVLLFGPMSFVMFDAVHT